MYSIGHNEIMQLLLFGRLQARAVGVMGHQELGVVIND